MGTTPRACSLPPEGGNYIPRRLPPEGGKYRPTRGFRLQAESRLAILLLVVFLPACAPRHPADDLTISTKVKIELLADPALGALRLDVSTLNGVVTLSGTVPSSSDADRAVAAAKRAPGVRDVKSALKVGG